LWLVCRSNRGAKVDQFFGKVDKVRWKVVQFSGKVVSFLPNLDNSAGEVVSFPIKVDNFRVRLGNVAARVVNFPIKVVSFEDEVVKVATRVVSLAEYVVTRGAKWTGWRGSFRRSGRPEQTRADGWQVAKLRRSFSGNCAAFQQIAWSPHPGPLPRKPRGGEGESCPPFSITTGRGFAREG